MSDIVGSMGHTALPLAALFLFLLAFGMVLARALRAGPRRAEHFARIPLDDDR